MKQDLQEIPINQIRVKKNYRKTFNDKSIAELAKSIKSNGVIQPIVVRTDGGDGFWVIGGERRLKAATQAGLVTIPAVIREDSDEAKILELQLVENIQKESVPFMEEAYGIRELRDKGSYDVKEIASMLGKSDTYIYGMLRIAAMSEEARRIAENGWISKGVAWEIAKALTNEEDQTKAANALARTNSSKLISQSGAKSYIADTFGDSPGGMRKRRVASFGLGSDKDYAANWKYHLVRFTAEQFDRFKKIVRGRTENAVLSEAVDAVMRETGTAVDVRGGG